MTATRTPIRRRGFNLVEMLVALAITAALMAATMVALDASFMAYQSTTEVASTHTIGRLVMNRLLTMIRTGQDFGPFPALPQDAIVESDSMEFLTADGDVLVIQWVQAEEALYVVRDPDGLNEWYLLLEGVSQNNPDDPMNPIPPFTLEFELGRKLHRATIDLVISPDDNMSVELDGDNTEEIRLVATAMPRMTAFAE